LSEAPRGSAAPRGRFITIEGGDGAGKTTQAGMLAAAFERGGIATRLTREPGGSAGGEAVRRLLLEGESEDWDAVGEALLLVAARRDHVQTLIAPALSRGIWVVCDRFADSTLAYQGYGRGLDVAQLAALHRFALGDFAPDLTVILDVAVEIAAARMAARATVLAPVLAGAQDRFERLDRGFRERLRRGFCQIAKDNPARCVLIDASGDPQAIHRAVLAAVECRLGPATRRHGADAGAAQI
jgi:dTMP kinase